MGNKKICVTAQANSLASEVDPRFGRCQYFIIVDIDSGEFEAVKNPNQDTVGGAGIQSGQLIADKKVDAVLTGNVGPNAFETLRAAGVMLITGVSGTVLEVCQKYKRGDYSLTDGPSVGSKFGVS